jgi:hypothetical protein
MPRISFTKFTSSNSPLVKRIGIKDGELEVEGATRITQGEYETVTCKWVKFGDYLNAVTSHECLGLGVSVWGGRGTIKAKAALKTNDKAIARSKENFQWGQGKSKLICLDIDHISDSRDVTPAEILERVLEQLPEFSKVSSGFWLKPSSSAYTHKDKDSGHTGLKGIHCYFLLPSQYDDQDVKEYVEKASWASNNSSVTLNGGLNASKRYGHLIDSSVFSPMRVVYEGDPICKDGVYIETDLKNATFYSSQGDDDFNWKNFDSEAAVKNKRLAELKIRPLQEATRKERHEIDRIANGRSKKDQKRIRENLNSGNFPASLIIHTGLGEVKGWEILLDPDKFHEATCQDPDEPDYDGSSQSKAMIFTDGQGVRIHSFAHGEHVVRVVWDLLGIKEATNKHSAEELEDMGTDWETIIAEASKGSGINESEISKVKDIVKDAYGGSKADIDEKVAAAGSVLCSKELTVKLKKFNETWCQAVTSNKVRYFRKTYDSTHNMEYLKGFDKDNMKSIEASNIVRKFNGKKMTEIVVADQWLKWGEKRTYPGGTYFNPHHDPSQGDLPNGCLNLYEGPALKRAGLEDWSCGKKRCEGKGCFKWSVENDFGICKEKVGKGGGNWTYYVNHIYEVICGNSGKNEVERRVHALWVLDWLVEVIQRPAEGFAWSRGITRKPGTSLVVRGGSGDGKGTIFAPLQSILGKYATQISDMGRVTGKFNSFMVSNIFVFADEATWGGGHAAAGVLKGMVSEERGEAELKGIDAETVITHTRLGVSSNTSWVIPTELDDRRFTVFDVSDVHHRDTPYFQKLRINDPKKFLDLCLDWEITSNLHENVENEALDGQNTQEDISPEDEFLLHLHYLLKVEEATVIPIERIKREIELVFGWADNINMVMPFYRRMNKRLKYFGINNPGKSKVKVKGRECSATDFTGMMSSGKWIIFVDLFGERVSG